MGQKRNYNWDIQEARRNFPMEKVKTVVEKAVNMPFGTAQMLYGISVLLTFGVIGRISMIL